MQSQPARLQIAKRSAMLLVLSLAAFVVLRGTVTMGAKYVQAKKVQDIYANELRDLDTQRAYLVQQLDALVSEDGMDYFVRDHYRVAKPGERLIIIVDEERE